jgi:hypothetical protein
MPLVRNYTSTYYYIIIYRVSLKKTYDRKNLSIMVSTIFLLAS